MSITNFIYTEVYENADFSASLSALAIKTFFFYHYQCYAHLFLRGIFMSFFKIFYCYSITVVCRFSPSLHPTPAATPSLPHLHPPLWFGPCVLYSSSCNTLFPLSPSNSPLVLLDGSKLQCLRLYFVGFFLLLIMFQLKVRSYGICSPPPGLFHLA